MTWRLPLEAVEALDEADEHQEQGLLSNVRTVLEHLF